MADYYTTPLPTVGVTPGPTWASTVNDILTLIEGHGHTGSDEVQITPAAMNINGPLNFNNNDLSGVGTLTATTINATTINATTFNTTSAFGYRLPVTSVSGTFGLVTAMSGYWLRMQGSNPVVNLPAQVAGVHFYISFSGTGTLTINATNGTQIVINNSASSTNGSCSSSLLGSVIHLATPEATAGWRALTVTGAWVLA